MLFTLSNYIQRVLIMFAKLKIYIICKVIKNQIKARSTILLRRYM